MNPPGPNPRAGVTGPIALHHSNRWPGRRTVPSMIRAGIQMLAPKKLRSLTGNHVFQDPSFDITGPCVAASAVESFGTSLTVTAATELAFTPPERPSRSLPIAAAVANASSFRPSFAGTTPTIVPPRVLRYVAEAASTWTPFATFD